MSALAVHITGTGLVSAAGYDAAASCAAIRCKIANVTETAFIVAGEPLFAAQISLPDDLRGHRKVLTLLGCAAAEALAEAVPADGPLLALIAVAEADRPGALLPDDQALLTALAGDLGLTLDPRSRVMRLGRWAGAAALYEARRELKQGQPRVLIAAYDSLLTGAAVNHLAATGRLITKDQPDGFIPGEAAAALMLSATPATGSVRLAGFGIGQESVLRGSEKRQRADGLSAAIRAAVQEAGRPMHQIGWRIAAVRGDQYDFAEDAAAMARTMRQVRPRFDSWTPMDCLGEIGAAAMPAVTVLAIHAFRRGYAPGDSVLIHLGGDGPERAACILDQGAAT